MSCDPVYWTRIVNKTGTNIIMELEFDKAAIEAEWNGRPYISYLEGRLNGGGTTILFDTLKLISKTSLAPNESFELEGGIGTRPKFFAIKKLTIFAKDTLIFDSKEKMKKAFKEVGNGNFALEIQ